jgi:hypothetical protein
MRLIMHRPLFLALLASGSLSLAGAALAEPLKFDSPDAAVAAVIAALEASDVDRMLEIFGPENKDVVSTSDATEDRELWGEFLRGAKVRTQIDLIDENTAELLVGQQAWPFPALIVRAEGGWAFDAEEARTEVLARRIGRHELAVIEILRRAPEMQAEYRRVDHDGDGVMEFAAAIVSGMGARDGLYWSDEPGTEPSPVGQGLARASLTGFAEDGVDVEPEPLYGYFFYILQGQGEAAPGGAYSYTINGNMVAGHAALAVPAVYGDSGIMSFMIGENGILYEADLGSDTLARAAGIKLFDPAEGWSPVE